MPNELLNEIRAQWIRVACILLEIGSDRKPGTRDAYRALSLSLEIVPGRISLPAVSIRPGDVLDAILRVEIVLVFVVVGVPNLGEERVFPGYGVKTPRRGHALRSPVSRL